MPRGRGSNSQERAESLRLSQQSDRITERLSELSRIDQTRSPLAVETLVLATLMRWLQSRVDDEEMRLPTCQRFMALLFDIQEEIVAERWKQLGKHGAN